MNLQTPRMQADQAKGAASSRTAELAAQSALWPRTPAKPVANASGGILIVDDTPANLQVLTGMLKERGYKVRPVPSGKLALSAARSEAPELILLDINMPDMNGYQVCEQLKGDDKLRGVPVIFISALT